ncbi:MAG: hypothetical protein VX589_05090, partial [Myxococcota bacterium]|nr:hypothetical protein [Myxococcota bacterium]
MNIRCLGLIMLVGGLIPMAAHGQIDQDMLSFEYNGYLETVGGQPVDQAVNFRFTLHNDPEIDGELWSEDHAGHQVTDGIVRIELG